MNNRIKQLIEQAEIKFESHPQHQGIDTAVIIPTDLEKFAELIVRKCADAADMAQDAGCEYAGDYVAEYMGFGQEHGVTEWRSK